MKKFFKLSIFLTVAAFCVATGGMAFAGADDWEVSYLDSELMGMHSVSADYTSATGVVVDFNSSTDISIYRNGNLEFDLGGVGALALPPIMYTNIGQPINPAGYSTALSGTAAGNIFIGNLHHGPMEINYVQAADDTVTGDMTFVLPGMIDMRDVPFTEGLVTTHNSRDSLIILPNDPNDASDPWLEVGNTVGTSYDGTPCVVLYINGAGLATASTPGATSDVAAIDELGIMATISGNQYIYLPGGDGMVPASPVDRYWFNIATTPGTNHIAVGSDIIGNYGSTIAAFTPNFTSSYVGDPPVSNPGTYSTLVYVAGSTFGAFNSALVVGFNGALVGTFMYDSGWTGLCGAPATLIEKYHDEIAMSFSFGTFLYNTGTSSFTSLCAMEANAVAEWGTKMVASFASDQSSPGLYLYDGSAWTDMITALPADILCNVGDYIIADFPDLGIMLLDTEFNMTTITAAHAEAILALSSDVAVLDLGSLGLYTYTVSTNSLDQVDATDPAETALINMVETF